MFEDFLLFTTSVHFIKRALTSLKQYYYLEKFTEAKAFKILKMSLWNIMQFYSKHALQTQFYFQ